MTGRPRKFSVLLADDHPVVRAGLRGMLATEPDVILMDLRMPGGDGVTATAAIRSRAQAGGGFLGTPSAPALGRTSPASGCVPRVSC